ncbi:beta-aspartyl-peptidase [Permianibacter sp. IMCC34836]|uniref:beta-aspartyl-peptidase n=1 Tax=Permianibacter fluminis TaxID=2738515 RepID=UPI001555BEB7|nr:beta-aspartyl-peptidase [Permianibacter fluminis]NQD35909.1 beta-aspartyl-peptidase [Permianibacter fluminis]
MITLIKNADVYAPDALGRNDILLAGERIARIAPQIELSGNDVTVVDGSMLIATPGLVDSLVHIIGGGGEGGFRTRTPELDFVDAALAGVTTLVGVLGTDAVTRTLTNLLAKASALTEEGLSCYCHTGSYQIPVKTLFDSVQEDLILIDKFIGVGEVAIADHRSSQPTLNELKKLAAEARVGGMLAGKGGIVSVHVGDAPEGLSLIEKLVAESDIPITQFLPTHINRNQRLFVTALDYARHGGYIDFTTSTTPELLAQGEVKCSRGLKEALDAGVPVSQITFSSDANASLPRFDAAGHFAGLGIGRIGSLLGEVRDAVLHEQVALADALSVVSRNPARALRLSQKGTLAAGMDADLLLLNSRLQVHSVWARGRLLVNKGELAVQPLLAD